MIIFDMPFAEYQKREGLSHSMIKELHPTPFHLQLYLRNPPESTPAQRLGTLAHSLILEPDKPLPKLSVQPAKYYPKQGEPGKEWNNNATLCHAWVAEQKAQGYDVVTAKDYEAFHGIAHSVANFKPSRELLEEGESEVCLFHPFAVRERSGELPDMLTFKCRFDWVTPGNTIMDVKTTTDASEDEFRWTILNNRYHSQGAWYLDLWNADPTRERKDCYVIIAVEKKPPYLCACYLLDDAMIEVGRQLNNADVATYAACKASGEWPAYPQEYVRMMLPEKYRPRT
jgi:PDDEXK-like domain of unknown function (DUF3799)